MIISTAGSMGVLTNTHTSSHYATSKRRWINQLLTFLGYPAFIGVSACYWWHKHVALHHPAPNVVGFDSDVDLSPWFARTKDEVEHSSGWRRVYYDKFQLFFLPLAMALIVFNMQISGWRNLLTGLQQTGNKRKEWIDFAAVLSHYVLWIVIPMLFFPPLHVLGFYALRVGLVGYTMFAVLAPGHFPLEAVCLKHDGQKRDRLLLQTAATVNFQTGVVGRLLCSGLEYQIEHHLFPGISHVYYRKMAPLVREFCRAEGLPYRSYQWDVALWKCLRAFQSPPMILTDLEVLRGTATATKS
jgi:fatty acid desaturase